MEELSSSARLSVTPEVLPAHIFAIFFLLKGRLEGALAVF
jgi:hypothetical protein